MTSIRSHRVGRAHAKLSRYYRATFGPYALAALRADLSAAVAAGNLRAANRLAAVRRAL
jgi:hypothetical protein